MDINYSAINKALVCGADNRGYVYYEYTEESVRRIAAKEVSTVSDREWRSLLQMLYPDCLICSGLFEPFLVFEITNGRRKDPPQEHWDSLVAPGSDGILLERFIAVLREHGIKVHESWYEALHRLLEITNDRERCAFCPDEWCVWLLDGQVCTFWRCVREDEGFDKPRENTIPVQAQKPGQAD